METQFKEFEINGNAYRVGPVTLGQYEDVLALSVHAPEKGAEILGAKLLSRLVRVALAPVLDEQEAISEADVNGIDYGKATDIIQYFFTCNAKSFPSFQGLIEVLVPTGSDPKTSPATSSSPEAQ